MNIAQAYHAALFPTEHVVLGLRLEAYTAGHEVLLDAFECPFLDGKPEDFYSFTDLVFGTFVCSQPWKDAKKSLTSGWAKKVVQFWSWRARKLNPAEEMLKFRGYLEQGRAFPDELKIKILDVHDLGAPAVHRTKIFMMQELGLSEEEFFARPLALSNADFCTIQEMYGKVASISDTEREAYRSAREAAL